MTDGIRINYGETLGKASIFAKNHDHTENILEIFGKEYRNLPGYAKVIDHYMTDVQIAIDEFSESNKLPQIAISVGMLDLSLIHIWKRKWHFCFSTGRHENRRITGIDV